MCIFAAPIPVGHRFECRWYEAREPKLFGEGDWKTVVHEPWLRDLETGIEYGTARPFEHAAMKPAYGPIHLGDDPNPEVRVGVSVVGIVRRCRVLTCVGFTGDPIQTHIDFELAAPTPGPAG